MTDSRSRILASLRRSLASARHLPQPPSVTLAPLASRHPPPDTLVQQFADELGKLGGVFIAEQTEQVPARVAQLLHDRRAAGTIGHSPLLAWQAESLPVPGLLDHLRREGFTVAGAEIPPGEPARARRLAEVEQVTVGLTGADAALADTGTLALRSGPGRPRLASLSVRTHIAIFTPDQLYPSWAAWWAEQSGLAEWVSGASNLSLISGPSRTADIEMTLTVGVHGPGEVIALLAQN